MLMMPYACYHIYIYIYIYIYIIIYIEAVIFEERHKRHGFHTDFTVCEITSLNFPLSRYVPWEGYDYTSKIELQNCSQVAISKIKELRKLPCIYVLGIVSL